MGFGSPLSRCAEQKPKLGLGKEKQFEKNNCVPKEHRKYLDWVENFNARDNIQLRASDIFCVRAGREIQKLGKRLSADRQ